MIYSAKQKSNTAIDKEDTRTSTIIGTMLYLPDKMIWEILKNACSDSEGLPNDVGNLETYEFWPQWDSKSANNSEFVEPDVFLRFKSLDIIIEAKRDDLESQSTEQWERELHGYLNKYTTGNKDVCLISLGGNGKNLQIESISIKNITKKIYKCSWVNLHNTIVKQYKKSEDGNSLRILYSLCLACNLFGFRSYRWIFDKKNLVDIFPIDCSGKEKIFNRG